MNRLLLIVALLLGACSWFAVCTAAEPADKSERVLLYAPKPEYPPTLWRRGVQGSGVLLLKIDPKTGSVYEVKILKSAKYPILNELAAKAALLSKFRPGTVTEYKVPFSFGVTGYSRTLH